MAIHPTALVDKGADIDASADIGPYCVIGPYVRIGAGTRLVSHVHVTADTTLGSGNVVHPFAALGGPPQDLKFKGERARLTIGDNNVIRESVTMNIGTAHGHMEVKVGSHCLFMAYSHVAHDCTVGSHVIVGNGVGLAGHVTVNDYAILGGLSGVHQFCELGRAAFIGGGSMVSQNVPPMCTAVGNRAQLAGLNIIGLRRAGWSRDKIHMVRSAFRSLFLSDLPRKQAFEVTEREYAGKAPEIDEILAFVRRSAKRGVCSARRGPRVADLPTEE